eukprot:Gb_14210 [translate_table: standard]
MTMVKVSASEVFMEGPLSVKEINICQSDGDPKSLLVVIPTADGDYPVLVFVHGFLLNHAFYTQLRKYVASRGYIAVARQGAVYGCSILVFNEDTWHHSIRL